MDDGRIWAALVGAPVWLAFLTYFVKTIGLGPNFMARWNERRRDTAEIESDQVERMDARMLRLEERCALLERQHAECLEFLHKAKSDHADERAGRLEAEALLMARQRADQEVQMRLSKGREENRVTDRAAGAADERRREEGNDGE